ncbi:MAG: sugar transferase [Acidobacteria bacterium]|nr:sugar transferase [Acidobacteriota bacterium]
MAFQFADLLMMVVAFTLATAYAADDMSFSRVLGMRFRIVNFLQFVLLLALWHVILRALGMYRSHRLSSPRAEAWRALQATTLGTLAILNCAILFNIRLVTPAFVAVFWLASSDLYVANRLVGRLLLARARRGGRNLRNVLIVGTNARAEEYAHKVEAHPELGYLVIGFVDDEWEGLDDFKRRSGRQVVATPAQLPEFLRANVVDELVIALPLGSCYERCARVIALCEEQGIVVRLFSDLFKLKLAKATVEELEDEPVVTIWTGAMEGWPVLLKRAFDVAVSAALLALLSPLMLLAALLVKLTSPGPVFFVQQRVGFNKRRIQVHKFRTMVADAERRLPELEHLNEVSGPVFKIRNDPRLTPIGKILRKTSIDELPQLLDVLLGSMSLVGPRPLPLRDYEGFHQDWHRRRFSVRPGITCLWQVDGRSSLPFERWMELDMQYIDQWSLLLDFKILLRTIPAVLRGTGAA